MPPILAAGSPTQPLQFQKMQSKEVGMGNGLAQPSPMFAQTPAQALSVLVSPAHITSSSVSSTVSTIVVLVEPSARTLTPTSRPHQIRHRQPTSFSSFSTSSKTYPRIAGHDYNTTSPDAFTSSAFDTPISSAFARIFSDPEWDEEVGVGLMLLQHLMDGGGFGEWGDLDEVRMRRS